MKKILFQLHWRFREWQERRSIRSSNDNATPMVAVYTMGKVGSTSVYYALKEVLKGRVVFVHRLLKDNIRKYDEMFESFGAKPHRAALASFFYEEWISAKKPTKIYVAFRDPVARNISDFFQDFEVFNQGKTHQQISVEKAIANFKEHYDQSIPANWFNQDFLIALGMQENNFEFDAIKKYGNMNHGTFDVLAVRTDLEDDKKMQLLSELLSMDLPALQTKNANHQKGYADYYTSFLEKIKFDPKALNDIYDQDYIKKLFTTEEIVAFKTKWSLG